MLTWGDAPPSLMRTAKRLMKPEVTIHTIYVLVGKRHFQNITDIAASLADKH